MSKKINSTILECYNRTVNLTEVILTERFDKSIRLHLKQKGRYIDLLFINEKDCFYFHRSLIGYEPFPPPHIIPTAMLDFEVEKDKKGE